MQTFLYSHPDPQSLMSTSVDIENTGSINTSQQSPVNIKFWPGVVLSYDLGLSVPGRRVLGSGQKNVSVFCANDERIT